MPNCFCGKERRESQVVCPFHFEAYKKEATKALVRGEAIELVEWAEVQTRQKLEELNFLEKELAQKNGAHKALRESVKEEAASRLSETIGGKSLPRESVIQAQNEIESILWKEQGGNKLHAEKKILEERIRDELGPLKELLQFIKRIKLQRTTREAVKEAEKITSKEEKNEGGNNPYTSLSPHDQKEEKPSGKPSPRVRGGRAGEKAFLRQGVPNGEFDE